MNYKTLCKSLLLFGVMAAVQNCKWRHSMEMLGSLSILALVALNMFALLTLKRNALVHHSFADWKREQLLVGQQLLKMPIHDHKLLLRTEQM